jgi:hypothetical protein
VLGAKRDLENLESIKDLAFGWGDSPHAHAKMCDKVNQEGLSIRLVVQKTGGWGSSKNSMKEF